MNAKQIKNENEAEELVNFSLISIEKVSKPSLWDRIRRNFAKPDLTLGQWQRLEAKRGRRPEDFSNLGDF